MVSASTIVDAVKKESGREKREGQGRLLGAFSKADSLRETLLERKNNARSVTGSQTKLRRRISTRALLSDASTQPPLFLDASGSSLPTRRLRVSLQASLAESLVPRKTEKMMSSVMVLVPVMESTQIMLGVGVAMVKLHVSLPLVSLTQTFILVWLLDLTHHTVTCASSFTLTIIGAVIGEESCNDNLACYRTSGKSETVECSMNLCESLNHQ